MLPRAFWQGKVMTGEQTRWGLENLNLASCWMPSAFQGVMRPISTSCQDHMVPLGLHPPVGRSQVQLVV